MRQFAVIYLVGHDDFVFVARERYCTIVALIGNRKGIRAQFALCPDLLRPGQPCLSIDNGLDMLPKYPLLARLF